MKEELVQVELIQSYPGFTVGEKVGFSPNIATRLIDRKIARPIKTRKRLNSDDDQKNKELEKRKVDFPHLQVFVKQHTGKNVSTYDEAKDALGL